MFSVRTGWLCGITRDWICTVRVNNQRERSWVARRRSNCSRPLCSKAVPEAKRISSVPAGAMARAALIRLAVTSEVNTNTRVNMSNDPILVCRLTSAMTRTAQRAQRR